MGVQVSEVVNRRDRRQFVELAWELYKNDPKWVPPIRGQLKQLLGWRPHAFYEQAESQAFLARRHGKTVGRILAILNRAHIECQNEPVGFFGFFEAIEDVEVAGRLLDAVRDWLKQHQIETIRGPVNPSLHHECGMLVEGFDYEPYFHTPYNPRYYARLMKQYGCRKARDLLGYIFFAPDIPQGVARFAQVHAENQHIEDVTIRTYSPKSLEDDLLHFLELYNESLVGLWGTVPLSKAEIRDIAGTLRWLTVPDLVAAADYQGKPIGVMLGLLDYGALLKQIDGRLFPFGLAKLVRGRDQIRRVRLMSMHISKRYRLGGIAPALFQTLLPALEKRRIEELEVSWTLEDNSLSRQSLESLGGQLYKRFRIYQYQ